MGNHKVIRTLTSKNCRYSTYDLIEAIKNTVVIWDREHTDFHNREIRQAAWHEVARHVYKSFDKDTPKGKETVIQTLQKRWKNTRDSFLRNWRLKQSGNDGARSAYIYDKELAFLLKCKEDSFNMHSIPCEAIITEPAVVAKAKPKKSTIQRTTQAKKRKATDAAAAVEGDNKKPLKTERHSSCSQPELEGHTEIHDTVAHLEDDSSWETEGTTTFDVFNVPETEQEEQPRIEEPLLVISAPMTCLAAPFAPNKIKVNNATDGEVPETPQNCANENFNKCSTSVPTTIVHSSDYDTDQAFFETIKPYLLKMTSDQKLDFQIDVLKLLRNYRH